ncbi:uncharacterized bromodomain-containing protein 10-like [Haliotis cracherodii]|uniref:uncharacterized bromodomain-containing protein 10-like n=1 Tax=Haliotis cracherodii TaxID=6455 RepID=UPI0039ECCC06
METEEGDYVSVEDNEICTVESGGTFYWNTDLGHPEFVEGTVSFVTNEDNSSVGEVEYEIGDSSEEQENEEEEEEDMEPLSFELQQGFRILRELMADANKSVTWHFLESVDASFPETHDYYDRIKSPMWLKKMDEKFRQHRYETITEFVADFRLMLENCFRYNGPDHYVSKRGQRLETMLEQKLALLSRDLREKTSISATSGGASEESFSASGLRRRIKTIVPHDSSALLNHLREEEVKQQREQRRQQIADRKAAQEAYLHNLQEWEDQLMQEPLRSQMKAMWEIPAIGHFLFLCQEPLNLEEVAHYELECSFLMPRQSSTMQRVMSSLLSTPFQRTKLDKRTMMPYCVWEEKLRKRIATWYKVLDDNQGNAYKASYKLGLDVHFFTVVGKKDPLVKKSFHELSFYRKVWIVKSLCDNCMETQESLRDAIEAQAVEEQRSYLLGEDAKGNTYIHFPQFCGADLRVYRQDPFPEPELESDVDEEEDEVKSEEEEMETPPVKKRRVNGSKSAAGGSARKASVGGRSSRRSARLPDTDDTEADNTPSEISTEPGSRSLTATPEIVDMEDECLYARRTRSGRSSRKSLYRNGITRELERALRKIGRCKVDDRGSDEREESMASDSERDYVSATDSNHNNNNCASQPDEQDSLDCVPSGGRSKGSSVERGSGVSRTDSPSPTCDSKQNGDNINIIKYEHKMCDVNSVDVKEEKCETDLTDSNGGMQCNGRTCDTSEDSKSAIANGDIPSDSFARDGSAVTEHQEGKGSSQGKGEMSEVKMKSHENENVVLDDPNSDLSAQNVHGADNSTDCESDIKCNIDAVKCESEVGENGQDCSSEIGKDDDSKPFMKDTDAKMQSSSVVKTEPGQDENECGVSVKEEAMSREENVQTDEAKIEEEEEEEILPELGSFELMADSVEDLRVLAEKFAEQPEPPTVSTRGKKQKSKPTSRKRCEVELHARLLYLLKELEPWETKLLQARRKARVKIRKELDEFKEEEFKKQDVESWNTEESSISSSEDTDAEDAGKDDQVEVKVKRSIIAPTPILTDSRDSLGGNVEEEYELDVSSRGRLRKRRVIPNNIEDQGIKKKKVIKSGEEPTSPAHMPNILQKQMKPMTSSTVISVAGASPSIQGLSASKILRMSILNQTQGKTSLISPGASAGNIRLTSLTSGVSVTQSSHPVIQSLLTTRQQQAATAPLQQVRPKPSAIQTIRPQYAAAKPGVLQASPKPSPGKQTLEVAGGNAPASTQKILNSLPASVIQQLLRHKAIKIQTTGPGGTTLFLTSAVPTSTSQPSASQPQQIGVQPQQPVTSCQPTQSVYTSLPGSQADVKLAIPSVSSAQHVNQFTVINQSMTSLPNVVPFSASPNIVPSLNPNIISGAGAGASTKPQLLVGTAPVASSPKPVMLTQQTSPSQISPNPSLTPDPMEQSSAKAYLTTNIVSPSKQKYASNVTVKALLENRASLKGPDLQSIINRSETVDGMASLLSSIRTTEAPALTAKTNINLCKVVLPATGGQLKPRVVKLPTQEALDSALQSVVTSVRTSLPTAHIKVPSPVTLPSIQPRRNVTKTIQSMKVPIPAAHRVESTYSPVNVTCPSSVNPSASESITSLSQVTKSPIKTEYVVQNPTATSSSQKNMLLKVVPQNFITSQGLVQGYLTPQGLVIPQNKQTVLSGGVQIASSVNLGGAASTTKTNQVHVALSNSGKDTVSQTAQLAAVKAVQDPGKHIQLSFSPGKQTISPASVQGLSAVNIAQGLNIMGKQVTGDGNPQQMTVQNQPATLASASNVIKAVKNTPLLSKVATPAAELVKQIAAGQSTMIQGTRMMVPAASTIQGKSTVMTNVGGKVPVSGQQTPAVIPALMVGQPAVASTPITPRLLVPAQQVGGTPVQYGKSMSISSSDVTNKQSNSVQLTGKGQTPFVLSLGSGLQNVILSPQKEASSQSASHIQNATLQMSAPQSYSKPTAVPQSVATLQLPVQSMQLNQQLLKLTPQQLSSALHISPQQTLSGVQVIQPQQQQQQQKQQISVSGSGQTVASKQIILSPQQLGNVAMTPGVKMVAQPSVGAGITALINKAPQFIQQKMATIQVAASPGQQDGKAPVLLQQHTAPAAGHSGKVLQVGQHQMLISKSLPQQPISSASVQTSKLQPSFKMPLSNIQQNPGVQFVYSPTANTATLAPEPISASSSPSIPNLSTNRVSIQAAQASTKAALQAHLSQTKASTNIPGTKPGTSTLSSMLGHEKVKVVAKTSPTNLIVSNANIVSQVVQAAEAKFPASTVVNNIIQAAKASAEGSKVSPTKIVSPLLEEGEGDGTGSKQQKLLLYNIGGQLMTAQGVPVTVEQGVLKVLPQATIQIGNQMLTIRSPSSAMVESPSPPKGAPHDGTPKTSLKPTQLASAQQGTNTNVLVQANIASAGLGPSSVISPSIQSDGKSLTSNHSRTTTLSPVCTLATADQLTAQSQQAFPGTLDSGDLLYGVDNQQEGYSIANNVQTGLQMTQTVVGQTDSNSTVTIRYPVSGEPQTGQLMSTVVDEPQAHLVTSSSVSKTKPVLQKTGSREEAALNLLSLANMSDR